jgi:hypothetical protein
VSRSPERVSQAISHVQEIGETVTSSRPRTVVRKSKILRSTRYLPLLGYYQYQSVTSPARWREYIEDSDDQRDHGEEAIQWKLIPAAWLSSQVFSMQKLKSFGNWQYTFKSVRVLPWEHSVFDACRSGSISAMILALKEGSASLNDVDDNGWTLLHVRMNLISIVSFRLERLAVSL